MSAPDTHRPEVIHLFTGHYHEVAPYRAWRAHGTPEWLLILTLDGKGRFGHSAGELIVEAGDAVLLRPETPHDYGVERSLERWELLWTHFQPKAEWLRWLRWPEVAPGLGLLSLLEPQVRRRVERRFLDAHHWALSGQQSREALAMNALEEVLIWCDSQNARAQEAQGDPRIQNVLEHLRAHLSSKLTLSTLAGVSGLSVSRLSHLFREQVGMTPQQYQEAQRLARARRLLELSTRTVAQIAAEVGFESPFYFTRRFKGHFGLSPSAYRATLGAPREVADRASTALEAEARLALEG